jgi:hypothetical protein
MFMHGMRRVALGLAVALAVAGLLVVPALVQSRTLAAPLTGGTDPAKWDVDGRGSIQVTLRENQVCYEYEVSNVAPVINVRIMERASWREVVVLQRGAAPNSNKCVAVDKDIVKALRRNPAAYAIVLGTSQYPSGALRANLALAMGLKVGDNLPPGFNKPGESDADHDNGYGNDWKQGGDNDDRPGNSGNARGKGKYPGNSNK